jgi:hypothetical protein
MTFILFNQGTFKGRWTRTSRGWKRWTEMSDCASPNARPPGSSVMNGNSLKRKCSWGVGSNPCRSGVIQGNFHWWWCCHNIWKAAFLQLVSPPERPWRWEAVSLARVHPMTACVSLFRVRPFVYVLFPTAVTRLCYTGKSNFITVPYFQRLPCEDFLHNDLNLT